MGLLFEIEIVVKVLVFQITCIWYANCKSLGLFFFFVFFWKVLKIDFALFYKVSPKIKNGKLLSYYLGLILPLMIK